MSETKRPRKPSVKHIADVQEPGTSAPSETSRPVIVTNRPLLKDPMVVEKKESEEEDEKLPQKPAETLSSSGKPDLRPLDDSIAPDGVASSDSAQEPDVPAPEPQSPADEAEKLPVAEDAAPTSNNNETDNDPALDPTVPPDATQTQADGQSGEAVPKNPEAKKAEAAAAEQAKHDAALQKLVDTRQYVLPINAVEKRKSKHFVALGIGLSVILVLLWLDIALDAGILKLGGLNSATHFFSN